MALRLMTLVSLAATAAAAAAADAYASPPSRGWTTTIAPGVHMPWVNLGTCCGSDPNIGVAPWLAASSALFAQPHIAGIDTAFDYDDQKAIAAQLKRAGGQGARGRVFITTKIPGAAFLNKDPKIVRMGGYEDARCCRGYWHLAHTDSRGKRPLSPARCGAPQHHVRPPRTRTLRCRVPSRAPKTNCPMFVGLPRFHTPLLVRPVAHHPVAHRPVAHCRSSPSSPSSPNPSLLTLHFLHPHAPLPTRRCRSALPKTIVPAPSLR